MKDDIQGITISAEYSTNLANQITSEMDERERQSLKNENRSRLLQHLKTIGALIVGLVTVTSALPQIISFLSGLLEKI